jgi:hypothetical protein
MAAPPVIVRILPTAYKLPEGFKTTIAFSLKPGVNLWEVDVPLPGADSTVIDTTTQLNIKWHTKWLSALVDSPEVSGTAAYDPSFYDDFIFLTGAQAGSWTVHTSTNTTVSCWGGLKSFVPQPHKHSTFPLMNFTVINTNYDPVNRVEAGVSTVPSVGTL